MCAVALAPAVRAFDAVAERFDERFGDWLSVAAQRRAVRAELMHAFPAGSRILEIGGGTGVDAAFLTECGRTVQLTDASPTMVRLAARRLEPLGAPSPVVADAENLSALAPQFGVFDGVFSNFAALNCIDDLARTAQGMAQLVRPGGRALLVIFGTLCPGEWIVELARENLQAAVRRFSRAQVPARLGGCHFTVRYHRRADVKRAFAPWFTLDSMTGIGVAVPPSAAEPWISGHPRLLRALEQCDRFIAAPLAFLGDHILYNLERTTTSADAQS